MIIIPVLRAFEKLRAVAPATVDMPGLEFHDRRKFAAQKHHGYATRARLMRTVTHICLHQTGCWMGERPGRYDGGGAHAFVTQRGKFIWEHDWDRVVVAANGFNAYSVSIEFDGLLAGIEGDPSTVWDNPATPQREQAMSLTDEQIDVGLDAIRWIVDDADRRGGHITTIVAHRQASAMRRSDPGQAPWQHVALPIAAELGLVAGGPAIGDGRPIPEDWDPSQTGVRY